MLKQKSLFIFFLVFSIIVVVNASQAFSEEKSPSILDLNESKVSGICPQQRNTPQAPEAFQGMTNPLDPTPDNLRAGKLLFKIDAKPTACKVCHGYGGDGMGIIFERLDPKPRNFTCYYTMEDISDGQIFWIIKNGSPGTAMPSFGALDDQQVWQLVLFIRQFTKK